MNPFKLIALLFGTFLFGGGVFGTLVFATFAYIVSVSRTEGADRKAIEEAETKTRQMRDDERAFWAKTYKDL